MACNYKCPNSHRTKHHRFLLCKHLMKDGVNYQDIDNACDVMCAHQHFCPTTKQTENTPQAKECYQSVNNG